MLNGHDLGDRGISKTKKKKRKKRREGKRKRGERKGMDPEILTKERKL